MQNLEQTIERSFLDKVRNSLNRMRNLTAGKLAVYSLAGVLSAGLGYGCESGDGNSNNKEICAPGDVKTCPCVGGQTGVQTCNSDGTSWGVCEGCGEESPYCTPNCTDKACGDNDCGGSCGECYQGYGCESFKCVELVSCGDGNCDESENYQNCPQDCECVSTCESKKCGDDPSDGCGGFCGWCFIGQDNGDGTVKDLITEFTWEKGNGGKMYWEDAKQYCKDVTLAGYSDWRLPNIDELRTLMKGCPATAATGDCNVHDFCSEEACYNSACYDNGCGFKEGAGPDGCYVDALFEDPCGFYWSSSSYYLDVNNNYQVWVLWTEHGEIDQAPEDSAGSIVRCVR